MRPKRSVVVLAGLLLALNGPASTAAAASLPYPMHVTKDCSTYTAAIPSYCTVKESNLAAIPVGAKMSRVPPAEPPGWAATRSGQEPPRTPTGPMVRMAMAVACF